MTIRWGIIGCGNVTEHKSGPAFQRARGSDLRFVMRRDAALARDYAHRHAVPRWTTDATELIHAPDVDAVYIATPVGTHASYAIEAMRAGKPAYVEKPMARHAKECEAMVAAASSAGQKLFVAYYRRALPRFELVKRRLDEGAVGTLTSVRYHYASPSHRKPAGGDLPWRLQARHAGGGLFLDLGSHALDIFDDLLGPLEGVQGHAARSTAGHHAVEETVAMSFRAAKGAVGVASWNFAADQRIDEVELTGTEGRLTFAVFGETPLVLRRGDDTELIEMGNPEHIQQPLIQSIVDELQGRGTCPSTGETAMRTSRVMDAVLSGYYGGRDDAFWERPETWPGARFDR